MEGVCLVEMICAFPWSSYIVAILLELRGGKVAMLGVGGGSLGARPSENGSFTPAARGGGESHFDIDLAVALGPPPPALGGLSTLFPVNADGVCSGVLVFEPGVFGGSQVVM